MAALPDFYEAFKTDDYHLAQDIEDGIEEGYVTGTRTFFHRNSNGKIIHYFGSKVVTPIEKKVRIPFFENVSIDDVMDIENGLAYMQALLNTEDSAKEMKRTLKKSRIIYVSSLDVLVDSPDEETRNKLHESVAFINYSTDNYLHVDLRSMGSRGFARTITPEPKPLYTQEEVCDCLSIVRTKQGACGRDYDLDSVESLLQKLRK